ncbi:MAG: hypothetical protein ACJA01_000322 [Saprospiraceae bacterium]|jgi:hypothetical protein
MSKFDDCMADYKGQLEKIGVKYDEALLTKVAKGLGPSIYNKDSSTVAASDKSEMNRVKTNFLIKKLGLSDGSALDEAIKDVTNQIGSSTKNKYRAVVYYLLTKKMGKESIYG